MRNETGGFQTGDINLAAALMACGVPLSPEDPVTIIQPENGRRYGSFRLMEITMDGRDKTADLMSAWDGKKDLPPGHGFEMICRFLRERPDDCRHTDDLMDFAMAWLGRLGFPCAGVRTFDDVPQFVTGRPASVDAFVLAFIHCRELIFQAYRRSKTDHFMIRGSGRDSRYAIISDNLPRWQRRELTSRLNG